MPNFRSAAARPRSSGSAPSYPRALATRAAAMLLAVNAACCGAAANGFDQGWDGGADAEHEAAQVQVDAGADSLQIDTGADSQQVDAGGDGAQVDVDLGADATDELQNDATPE